MEIVRYFFYKGRFLLYLVLAILLSLLLGFFVGFGEIVALSILLFLELCLLRLVDDRADYEGDAKRGRKQLPKSRLGVLIILFSSCFTALNVILFGSGGVWSLALLMLILWKEKSYSIPPLIGVISAVYYLSRYKSHTSFSWREGLFLTLIFSLSAAYAMKKRKKR